MFQIPKMSNTINIFITYGVQYTDECSPHGLHASNSMPWRHMGGFELLQCRTGGVLNLWWVISGEIVHVRTGFHIEIT